MQQLEASKGWAAGCGCWNLNKDQLTGCDFWEAQLAHRCPAGREKTKYYPGFILLSPFSILPVFLIGRIHTEVKRQRSFQGHKTGWRWRGESGRGGSHKVTSTGRSWTRGLPYNNHSINIIIIVQSVCWLLPPTPAHPIHSKFLLLNDDDRKVLIWWRVLFPSLPLGCVEDSESLLKSLLKWYLLCEFLCCVLSRMSSASFIVSQHITMEPLDTGHWDYTLRYVSHLDIRGSHHLFWV